MQPREYWLLIIYIYVFIYNIYIFKHFSLHLRAFETVVTFAILCTNAVAREKHFLLIMNQYLYSRCLRCT